MPTFEEAQRQFGSSLIESFQCGKPVNGYEVFITPFLYPDLDRIEVFVKHLAHGDVLVSDLGQTAMKLDAHGFDLAIGRGRLALARQIASSCGVRFEDGSISLVARPESTGQAAWDVAIAAQRLADLAFTVSAYGESAFASQPEPIAY